MIARAKVVILIKFVEFFLAHHPQLLQCFISNEILRAPKPVNLLTLSLGR